MNLRLIFLGESNAVIFFLWGDGWCFYFWLIAHGTFAAWGTIWCWGLNPGLLQSMTRKTQAIELSLEGQDSASM